MSQGSEQTATLKIWRGAARESGRWESHQVPFEPGQSVLDGLRWLRIHKDPTLAVRFSCINANACKECMIQVDGETGLRLHGTARTARNDSHAAAEQKTRARSGDGNRAAVRAVRVIAGCSNSDAQRRRRNGAAGKAAHVLRSRLWNS